MRILPCAMVWLMLAACVTPATGPETATGAAGQRSIRSLSATEAGGSAGVGGTAIGQAQQRLLADQLFAGLQALDADRLLIPVDDSAHGYFQRVLAYQPDNAIALQGLQDIVARYLELAQQASQQGQFEQAAVLLQRARLVDADHPAIEAATWVMLAEQNSGDLFFVFDSKALAARTASIRNRLVEVAQQAREHQAWFLITAPTDELARWMFRIMRDAVPDYRLRGNIELASRAGIRLRMPTAADPETAAGAAVP